MKYVKLNGNTIQRLSDTEALNYLDEKELNNAGYKEFVPATYEQGKPYKWSYEETETHIIEHVEEIVPDPFRQTKHTPDDRISQRRIRKNEANDRREHRERRVS